MIYFSFDIETGTVFDLCSTIYNLKSISNEETSFCSDCYIWINIKR